jgi:hypothetical protein
MQININPALIEPALTLLLGLMVLLVPRLLRYLVALYLIALGVWGLMRHF